MRLAPTPGQTVGPFFHYGLPYDGDRNLVPPGSTGSIALHGVVLDGAGVAVPDALIEVWQARPDGTVSREAGSIRRDGWAFTGFGRTSTGRDGRYVFSTLEPGPTEPARPAFWAITVFARGLLDGLFTRAYIPGPDIDIDPFLASLPHERRATMLAQPGDRGYRFDIRLQGQDETVFLRFDGSERRRP
ncbi:MAG: pcaG [Nocardioides sp.]|uniref:protocatechuate 3,4-dioxygenase subunit alpha n=1 Tax=Nocardioides sp. TaxID=35761 RepID=UPI002614DDE4|nr:protocatechuate 3,4-dioxygenase subunit alpha [Nocardioides sp.]MCW2835015.1 pcaG [Nocardioides sp.]